MNRKYLYYPGCSLHSTSRAYDESSREVAKALGIELEEIKDWNCCGATAYMGIRELTAFSISARNLALAEEQGGGDVIAPCSGCFVGLTKTNKYLAEFPDVHEKVNEALAAGGLEYKGTVKVRHFLDVFSRDLTFDDVKKSVVKELKGLKVACYYGCQIVRPRNEIDDAEDPHVMEDLVKACAATPVDFALKVSCCSGSVMGTEESIGVGLVGGIIECARRSGADVIITPCPLCQMNLDAYQGKAMAKRGTKFEIPILYFTQLLGLALGVPPRKLGIQRGIAGPNDALKVFL